MDARFVFKCGQEIRLPLSSQEDVDTVTGILSEAITRGDRCVLLTVPFDRTVFIMLDDLVHVTLGPTKEESLWDALHSVTGDEQ